MADHTIAAAMAKTATAARTGERAAEEAGRHDHDVDTAGATKAPRCVEPVRADGESHAVPEGLEAYRVLARTPYRR